MERPTCLKAAFTHAEARNCAKMWRQRPYQCPVCWKWHLSKQGRDTRGKNRNDLESWDDWG